MKSKFAEDQIVNTIRENESGTKGAEIGRRLGISQATFFTWEKKYGDSVMLAQFTITKAIHERFVYHILPKMINKAF